MEGEMASRMDKQCVQSTTKATVISQRRGIIWQRFHINKRGQYCRVPVLLLVVDWQLFID